MVDADLIARQVVEPDQPAYRQILRHFGHFEPSILMLDGSRRLNRERLGQLVFGDAELRRLLNRCTHPWIRREIVRQILKLWATGCPLIVLDAPLLIESSLHRWVHQVVVVHW